PSRRTATRPTSFRTRRCLETLGCSKPSAVTMSPTGRSWRARKERIARRRGSATALKASELVEARGMEPIYTHIGICQEGFLGDGGGREKFGLLRSKMTSYTPAWQNAE